MELKKLLMTSGKEGVCRRPGSPKMEGAGKKGQLQVCGQNSFHGIPPAVASLHCHLQWQ